MTPRCDLKWEGGNRCVLPEGHSHSDDFTGHVFRTEVEDEGTVTDRLLLAILDELTLMTRCAGCGGTLARHQPQFHPGCDPDQPPTRGARMTTWTPEDFDPALDTREPSPLPDLPATPDGPMLRIEQRLSLCAHCDLDAPGICTCPGVDEYREDVPYLIGVIQSFVERDLANRTGFRSRFRNDPPPQQETPE